MEPRRSRYRASDVAALTERKARGRKAADVARAAIEWGEPVLASAITTVADGRLYYRGRDAVRLAEADPTIESVELSGAGPAFCSGGDLDEFGLATDLVAACLVRLSRAPWRVIERIAPKVTVFAHGACVGAGAEITAYAGRVVAAPDAFFALPEVRMGLVPGAGGSVSVVRRIGRWRAAWLMLTGERLPAVTALRWGLVDEITPGAVTPGAVTPPPGWAGRLAPVTSPGGAQAPGRAGSGR